MNTPFKDVFKRNRKMPEIKWATIVSQNFLRKVTISFVKFRNYTQIRYKNFKVFILKGREL
ncbi:hypothetical protein A6B38_00290 [Bartonella bacilliformis]|uniref:Uncharacterized protein n=1 Tax=Bartonella bacilliformis INS TaxID=1206782 RepID=A0ABN0IHQ3_BARBA|nr:hypothetical protein AL467_00865 [Bartonella bacilliformis]EKS46037.1 hypothetical protein BbINS_00705 [Bartonella bacilliformis INS]KZM38131.1 hypothetical protein AWH67_00455 [Bartonella bacilliformis]KZN22147.1 hypothetical protein A6B38_00290 [Bartonella bacilliformis]